MRCTGLSLFCIVSCLRSSMKKILFIVNPVSGGKSKKPYLEAIDRFLDKEVYSYRTAFTEYSGHASELARDCEEDTVVAVGGDGTVSEVARGLIGTGKTFGIIPCGSGDGLALHLGIGRNPRKAIEVLNSQCVRMMDYGKVDGKPFFCTVGVGFDAIVAERFAGSSSRGLATYITTALRTWMGFKPDTYSVTVDGEVHTCPASMITVGNVNQWGNQARITSLASVTDGMLDVAIVHPFHTVEIPVLAVKLLCGRAHTSSRVTMLRGKRIMIERSCDGPAHCDGDPSVMGRRIVLETVPAALPVLVPKIRNI